MIWPTSNHLVDHFLVFFVACKFLFILLKFHCSVLAVLQAIPSISFSLMDWIQNYLLLRRLGL